MDKETHKKICGAKRKKAHGQVCQLPPSKGRTRCRFHGGHSPVGPASATWKHGRYSKYFPTGLRTKYQAFLHDPTRLTLDHEIATCDTHMTELLAELAQAINQKQPAEQIWNRIHLCMEARRRLTESQRKYEVEMGSMLSLEQAHQLVAALATIIKEESIRFFPDVQVRRAFCMAVSNKFEPLLCDASPPDRQKIKNF